MSGPPFDRLYEFGEVCPDIDDRFWVSTRKHSDYTNQWIYVRKERKMDSIHEIVVGDTVRWMNLCDQRSSFCDGVVKEIHVRSASGHRYVDLRVTRVGDAKLLSGRALTVDGVEFVNECVLEKLFDGLATFECYLRWCENRRVLEPRPWILGDEFVPMTELQIRAAKTCSAAEMTTELLSRRLRDTIEYHEELRHNTFAIEPPFFEF